MLHAFQFARLGEIVEAQLRAAGEDWRELCPPGIPRLLPAGLHGALADAAGSRSWDVNEGLTLALLDNSVLQELLLLYSDPWLWRETVPLSREDALRSGLALLDLELRAWPEQELLIALHTATIDTGITLVF